MLPHGRGSVERGRAGDYVIIVFAEGEWKIA
jgi:hypothetical protein